MNNGTFGSNDMNTPAVFANGINGAFGVFALSDSGTGIQASSQGGLAGDFRVTGAAGPAVSVVSDRGIGIQVRGVQYAGRFEGTDIGIQAQGGQYAGIFAGNVSVTGTVSAQGQGDLHAASFEGNVSVTGVVGVNGGIEANSQGDYAVKAINHHPNSNGVGIYAEADQYAGVFEGNVSVRGNVSVTGDVILTGADCAEEFDVAETTTLEPGTVVVLDQDGAVHQSHQAYDKRVAGVISGAGDYKPGLILDRQQAQENRLPIALIGKVYCKVDAQYSPVEVGDLLTTSSTPGHAMKADNPLKAFGSVIGKALRSLEAGQGMIPILIALQ